MFVLSRSGFEELVAEAFDRLPPAFRDRLENVAILVEDWPDRETLRLAGLRDRRALLGFYHGVPLTERTHDYGMVPPDKISLYRWPILLGCEDEAQARELIGRVLRHEIAHHFGIDDDRLEELDAY